MQAHWLMWNITVRCDRTQIMLINGLLFRACTVWTNIMQALSFVFINIPLICSYIIKVSKQINFSHCSGYRCINKSIIALHFVSVGAFIFVVFSAGRIKFTLIASDDKTLSRVSACGMLFRLRVSEKRFYVFLSARFRARIFEDKRKESARAFVSRCGGGGGGA